MSAAAEEPKAMDATVSVPDEPAAAAAVAVPAVEEAPVAEVAPAAVEVTAAAVPVAVAAPTSAVSEPAAAPAATATPVVAPAAAVAAPVVAPGVVAAPAAVVAPEVAAPVAKTQDTPTSPDTSDGDDNKPDLTEAEAEVVTRLRELQTRHEAFELEYLKEWNLLKLKYLTKFRPLYASRKEILCEQPTNVPEGKPTPVGTTNLTGFWLRALKNQRTMADIITDRDEPVLTYLTDIRSDWMNEEEQLSFMLTFSFAANPYFDHEVLTKAYNMDRDDDGEGVLLNTKGTEIKWHPNKDVTKVVVTKRQRNPRTKATRVVKDVKTVPSFFDFFNSLDFPTPEQFVAMDPEEAKEMEDEVEAEFDVGCIIREKIIPHALGWFMGEETDEISDDDSEFSIDEEYDGADSDDDRD